MGYREYCKSNYGRVIDFPLLPTVASEDLARERCKKIWCERYPKEPFEIMAQLCLLPGSFGTAGQVIQIDELQVSELDDLVPLIARQSSFYYQVSGATKKLGRGVFISGTLTVLQDPRVCSKCIRNPCL